MGLAAIPPEILEHIVSQLDIPSALSFIQVNRYVNESLKKNKRFWSRVANYIGLEVKEKDSTDDIKRRFIAWKSGGFSCINMIVKVI